MGYGFAAAIINGHPLAVDFMPGNRGVDRPVRHAGTSLHERQINLFNLSFGELLRKRMVGGIGFGHHDAAAGLLVEPMDDPWALDSADYRDSAAVVEQGINDRAIGIARAWMHDEPGRLV